MVRKIIENQFDGTKKYVELACKSTDTKPTGGMVTGSLALEVDTGDIYAYDETGDGSWGKIAELIETAAETPSASVNDSRGAMRTEAPDEPKTEPEEEPAEEPEDEPAEEPKEEKPDGDQR